MEDSEELRETLFAMRRECDLLRTETTHANLLLTALDAVLCVDGEDDPFAGVFAALLPVFEAVCSIVLIERDGTVEASSNVYGPEARLQCIASSHPAPIGSRWPANRLFQKILGGKVVSSVLAGVSWPWPEDLATMLSGEPPALYFPLAVRERRGLMILLRAAGQPGFDRADMSLARKFSLLASHALAARQASLTEAESNRLKDLTERLEASQEELRYRADYDQLTGLPNRAHVRDLVGEMIARKPSGEMLALAFVDLDEFKRVNDVHGHAAGDALLQEVASRVRGEIRHSDVFGRISGDEFVVAFDPLMRREDVDPIIARVRERLMQPFAIEGVEIRPSASIGIAFYPDHGRDYETLRRHADLAMYQAKETTKGSVSYFTRDLGREEDERLLLEQRIRGAIAGRAFCCALQQKVNIRTRAIVGFEALARWVDDDGMVRAPGTFMPLAAKLNLIDDITMLVVTDLMDHLPRIDARFGAHVRYSLNISPAQTTNIPFMLKLVQRLAASGCPSRFVLELTEEAFAATGPFQTHVLPVLRAAGVAISIDDFGTGYSSLAKLAELTVDEIKIDRSLVAFIHERPRNQVILRAVESLGAALNMSIVAEGIETAAENRYLLTETNVLIGQGFLHHRPALIRALLDGHAGDTLTSAALSAPGAGRYAQAR